MTILETPQPLPGHTAPELCVIQFYSVFRIANEQLILSKSNCKSKRGKNELTQKDRNNRRSIVYNCNGYEFAVLCYCNPYSGCSRLSCKVSENANQVIIGVLLYLIDCAAVVAIPIMLFPIFKKHNEALALGYVGSRIIESVTLIVGHISLLSLLTLSQEYVQAGAPDATNFQALGALLLAVIDRALLLGVEFVFSVTALILNYLLFRSKLIPRFISVWGLIGATLLLVSGFLVMFGLSPSPTSAISMLLSLPISLQEMVFAVWLIGKGFNSYAITFGSAKTDVNEIK